MNKSICELCGEPEAEHCNTEVTYNYKGEDLVIMQPGTWCTACDEGILDHKDREVNEDLLSKFRSDVDNGRC